MPAKADCPKGKTQLSVLVSSRTLAAFRRLAKLRGQNLGLAVDRALGRELAGGGADDDPGDAVHPAKPQGEA